MDDEDSLLGRIDEIDSIEVDEISGEGEAVENVDVEMAEPAAEEEDDDIDIDGALDYSEEPIEEDDDEDDGEISDSGEEVKGNQDEEGMKDDDEKKKEEEEKKKKEEELEDGELEDSEDEKEKKEKSDGELSDDNDETDTIRVRVDGNRFGGRDNYSSSIRKPIESRLSRPGRPVPLIRGIPAPKRERVMESAWEKSLKETKNLMEKAESRRAEDPDFERKRLLAVPKGEREHGRRAAEFSSDEAAREDLERDISPFREDMPERSHIPSLMMIRTRTPPPNSRGRKDLGPQCLYPNRDRTGPGAVLNQSRTIAGSGKLHHVKREPIQAPQNTQNRSFERKDNRIDPRDKKKAIDSPPRGISFSPTRDASPISSDSDSEAMHKKRSPSATSTKSSATDSSKSTYNSKGSSSESRSSSEDKAREKRKSSEKKKNPNEYSDPWARRTKSSADDASSKRSNISPASSPSPSRERERDRKRAHKNEREHDHEDKRRQRTRSSSNTPSPSRFHFNKKGVRHMKRKVGSGGSVGGNSSHPPQRGNDHRARHSRSRTRSPPPYPPGMKPSGARNHRRSQNAQSPPCGDITSYRIPKRNSGAISSSNDRKPFTAKKTGYRQNNNGDSMPSFLSNRGASGGGNRQNRERVDSHRSQKQDRIAPAEEKRGKDKNKKKSLEEAIETISDSDSGREKRSRKSRSRTTSSSSASSRSGSGSSSSNSSRSSSPELPARYRPRASPRAEEKPSVEKKRSLDKTDKSVTAERISISDTETPPTSPPRKRRKPAATPSPKSSPPPPASSIIIKKEEIADIPPPPPPMNESSSASSSSFPVPPPPAPPDFEENGAGKSSDGLDIEPPPQPETEEDLAEKQMKKKKRQQLKAQLDFLNRQIKEKSVTS